MRVTRWRFLVLLFGLVSFVASAADYPSNPIFVIVPQAAGGTNDIVGRLIAIGVSSSTRSPRLLDVPAIGEHASGYSGTLWVSLVGVRGVSANGQVKRMDAMKKVLASPATQAKLQAQGVDLASATPAQFATLSQVDIARWARIVKEFGATID